MEPTGFGRKLTARAVGRSHVYEILTAEAYTLKDNLSLSRRDYGQAAGRSIALPMAGAVVWSLVAIAGAMITPRSAALLLFIGSGLIFPLGLLLARLLHEDLLAASPLARLMGLSVLMVNLQWPLHIALYLQDPTFLPLSLGVGLGLHWLIFGWIVQHPVGLIHATSRSVALPVVWLAFPNDRFVAVPLATVFIYIVTLVILLKRKHVYTQADSE